ncbi:acetylserotonin O-methyltransferase-like [Ptychodera flava]|uniref:acetylserotonin O-methyltransferase-like n=1 Tax=Ptychodera flava TaxID=63121 RepID=UPI00396A9D2C
MDDRNVNLTAAGVFDTITGFLRSQILFAASELGVFDALASDDEKKKTALQLATELSTDVDAMERLLNSCVSLHLLSKSLDPDKNALYWNTEATSQYLTVGATTSLRGFIRHYKMTMYPLMANLDHAVREGKDQLVKTFGVPAAGSMRNLRG